MFILIGCEESQAICKAARALGLEAYSCDLQECSGGHPEWHIIEDILVVMMGGTFITQAGTTVTVYRWDKMIAHPVCTYLTCSAEWAYKDPDYIRYPRIGYHQKLKPDTLFGAARRQAREKALEFACALLNAPIKEKGIENPVGVISGRIWWDGNKWAVTRLKVKGIQPQVVQPHWFGDDASKATAFYFVGMKKLKPTSHVPPRIVNGQKRWANQTDSGQNNFPPSKDRAKERSKTYPGLAKAIAEQLLNSAPGR